MIQKAGSISECPDIERLWHLDQTSMSGNVTTSHAIQLSHSDIGPYIHMLCPEGYHVVGPKMVTCLKGGRWDDTARPYCSASLLYEIPESTVLMIGVLSSCGAVILLAITIILAHLLCFRRRRAPRPALSSDHLDRSIESMAATKYYTEDKSYSISSPKYPTLNGKPITMERHHYNNTAPSHLAPRVNGHIETISDGEVFVNHAFVEEFPRQYQTRWEHEMQPIEYRTEIARQPPTFPPGIQDNRTMF